MRRVFYSFHYGADVMRVMNIRNMGILEYNKPVQINKWEEIKRSGDDAVKKWIDDTMKNCSCVVVLIGEHTYQRPWVKYEIQHAWNINKGLLGIYIHDLHPVNDSIANYGVQGENPFSYFQLSQISVLPFCDGEDKVIRLDSVVPAVLPNRRDTYNDIKSNISQWVERAIDIRNQYAGYECKKAQKVRTAESMWENL